MIIHICSDTHTHTAVISSISAFGPSLSGPGQSSATGQEGCLSEGSTKHFKATQDWQRQRDDWGDREGRGSARGEAGEGEYLSKLHSRERGKEGGSVPHADHQLCSARVDVHVIRGSFLVNCVCFLKRNERKC